MPASPVTYLVDEGRKLVETTIREGFRYSDILACFAMMRADPRIRPDFDRVAVYEVSAAALTSAQVREMVESARVVPHGSGTKVAIVVPDDVTYGMMRMYELYGGQQGTSAGVFRSRAEADAWLRERDP